ncbi:hypothetical protein BDW22DRAFT_1352794 [Trametopsis cervina]|nr:hypothetical protein BDW22DRAFT_1352794 [Trametopsis cervina]
MRSDDVTLMRKFDLTGDHKQVCLAVPSPVSLPLSCMATLTRPTSASETGFRYNTHDLTTGIPQPFPTEAEREQEELLDTLADEELRLEEGVPLTHGASLADAQQASRLTSEDLVPSRIGQVQSTCLTALRDLLVGSVGSPVTMSDRRRSMPSTSEPIHGLRGLVDDLRSLAVDGQTTEKTSSLSENELIAELRGRVGRLTSQLSARDAELAQTVVSLLAHLHHLAPFGSNESTSTSPRAVSWGGSVEDPYATLRRQVNDFQLERSSSHENLPRGNTSGQSVEAGLLWLEVDAELEAVVSLCRSHAVDDPFADHLPPEYDPGEYEYDNLPEYEPADGDVDYASKSSHKAESILNGSSGRLYDSANEKMKMDLEAVTLAIDRLYSVAPQLHNQRVELKKTKVDEMERAKRKGKQRAADGDNAIRELDTMLELISKASDRKMTNQAVFIDDATMKRKMEISTRMAQEKRAAFVDKLANHSEAGRMHSQDASLLPSRTHSAMERNPDPHALLSLPEFIREGIPDTVQQRMQLERNPDALLSLPEFIKEHPLPQSPPVPRFTHGQSNSQVIPTLASHQDDIPPTTSRLKGHRSRSLSEPLAWLLSARPSSPSSGSGLSLKRRSSKYFRPDSSPGHGSIPEEQLAVTYVAEFHENLQHVLVFLDVSGLRAGHDLQAEVFSQGIAGPSRLVLRCDTIVSAPLALPTRVTPGPATVSVVGGRHYQIKLSTAHTGEDASAGVDHSESRDLLDATYFQSTQPTAFICSSCSLPLVRASRLSKYRDLPSEHWAELVDAWMCHSDQKLHEHVQKGSKEGFWPADGEALVGGSYVLAREDVVVKVNLCDVEPTSAGAKIDDWHRVRCICGAIVGRSRQHTNSEGSVLVYRLAKYAFRPVSPTAEPSRVPLSAFIVEDMNEHVHAHATYRFVIADEEQERPRLLVWLFKPNMRLAYATPSPYVIAKDGSMRVGKVLFKILGPSTVPDDYPALLDKYPGFPHAEHLYYPLEICRRLAALLKESNLAYPESMRTMTGLDVGWLQRA